MRLGGRRWQLLHRLVYVSASAGVVHYFWRVKLNIERPMIYASILAVLLMLRAWFFAKGTKTLAASTIKS